uniref:Uncharacterized protein n=1 Tax=Trichobilharzia regenti TaxID=157069 RepID=A0AA85JFZ5_TRIRE|nr:unnamed protein product [Trichobilharzia regenti]
MFHCVIHLIIKLIWNYLIPQCPSFTHILISDALHVSTSSLQTPNLQRLKIRRIKIVKILTKAFVVFCFVSSLLWFDTCSYVPRDSCLVHTAEEKLATPERHSETVFMCDAVAHSLLESLCHF